MQIDTLHFLLYKQILNTKWCLYCSSTMYELKNKIKIESEYIHTGLIHFRYKVLVLICTHLFSVHIQLFLIVKNY